MVASVDPGVASIVVAIIALAGAALSTWQSNRQRVDLKGQRADIREVQHHVTANHHESETPTLPDRLDEVLIEIRGLRDNVDQHRADTARELVALWRALHEHDGR